MTTTDFHVFDTTLRDGAQRDGVSYSVADKLAVARLMDEVGVGFIEGGWPGALPKDTEFFARARTELKLRHAQLVEKAGHRELVDHGVGDSLALGAVAQGGVEDLVRHGVSFPQTTKRPPANARGLRAQKTGCAR